MKLRCSYTLLQLWRGGRFQEAVDYYLKKKQFTSKAMEEGKKWDEYVNDYVVKHKKLPEEFGGDTLVDPTPQMKIVVPYNEMCDLVGVFDVVDEKTLYEVKTGNAKDSADYATDFQVSMYFALADLQGIPLDKAYIVHFDQHSGGHDRSLIWNTPFEVERGRNFVETLVPEIHKYFEENGVLTQRVQPNII